MFQPTPPPPPVPPTKQQYLCQPLLDAVLANIRSPVFNHSLYRTFMPAMTAIHGQPITYVPRAAARPGGSLLQGKWLCENYSKNRWVCGWGWPVAFLFSRVKYWTSRALHVFTWSLCGLCLTGPPLLPLESGNMKRTKDRPYQMSYKEKLQD